MEIPEQICDLDTELGGNMFDWLNIKDMDSKPLKMQIIEITTDRVVDKKGKDWGKRVILNLCNEEGYGYKVADWNFKMKEKVKASEIIGKYIYVTKLDDKKVMITFI